MMPGTVVERTEPQVTSVPLVERRRAGEEFPRVPVGSVELTREQVAAVLCAELERVPEMPGYEDLMDAVRWGLHRCDAAGLEARLARLTALPMEDQRAQRAWSWAYRLCRAYWYEGAASVPLRQEQVAAALYASDIEVRPGFSSVRGAAEVNSHLAEGVSRLGANRMVELGESAYDEFGCRPVPGAKQSADYLAAMPDRKRRRWCYRVAVNRSAARGSLPLLVCLFSGEHAVGITPPEDPHAVAHERLNRGGAA
ncbi:hypothetical protein LHJ74_21065 [Streptomyces sp. N2-109]|uniref:Uncharacterized protein n=1 Tax=Streptomyces gossypii TaxID=2883101 RepID=A0ABT2JWT4_9ACTN|nr:hypothetical protein [Streptomyces gossypii]MCT2592364.1 hypothetical protein [Streptomyces gossypii]